LEVTEKRRGEYAAAALTPEELEEFLLAAGSRVDLKALRAVAKRNKRDPGGLLEVIAAIDSRDPGKVRSPRLRALFNKNDGDPSRVELFADLAGFLSELASERIEGRAWSSDDAVQFDRYCFISAYFSNYIEGTEFLPEDAIGIVYRGEDHGPAPDQRTLAATHQTYLSLLSTMTPPAVNAPYAAFESYLKRLHHSLAGGNPALRSALALIGAQPIGTSGRDEEARELARAFRALPAGDFQDVPFEELVGGSADLIFSRLFVCIKIRLCQIWVQTHGLGCYTNEEADAAQNVRAPLLNPF